MSFDLLRVLPAALALAAAIPASAADERPFVPVTDAMLQKPDAADWLMWRRTLDGWGYSPLNQINKRNVARLHARVDATRWARAFKNRRRSFTTA